MFYVLLGLCCLYLIWKLKSSKTHSLEPPELPGKLPLIGHGYRFLGNGVAYYNTIRKMSEECTERGGVNKIYMASIPVYVVTEPEDALTIANTCLQKHYIYDFMRPFFANGLLNADVPTWIKHRKLLNPAFSQAVLDGYIETFNSQAQRLFDQFANELGNEFDHEIMLRSNNLETICSTATGVDIKEFGNLRKQFLPSVAEYLQVYNQRVQTFWLHNDFVYNMSSLKKKHDELLKKLTLTDSIIQRRKYNKITDPETKSKKCKSFIDIILELAEDNNSFTEEQMRGETNTIIVAGYDTSASALTFALTLLGSNAQIQEKAYKETIEVIGNSGKNLDKEALSKLVYTEAILKETLRLYPSAPLYARHLDKDVKLKNYSLKANTGCYILSYGILRHKMWGSDANTFRPERWLEKETLPDPKYYAAFGVGRRACIGRVYALMSMKIIIAKVLQKYRISSDITKMEIELATLIRPFSGHHISLEQRT